MGSLKTGARYRSGGALGLLMSALALASAPSAMAQDTCTTDDDCEHGYSCETNTACPDIACAPGETCDPIDCQATSACVPARDCAEDGDCIEGWKCATATYARCDAGGAAEPVPACKPDDPDCAEADPPQNPEPPPSCEPIVEQYCAPPWALPCETAADCGPGFECTEQVARCSSGSSGSSSGGGSDPSPGEGGAGGEQGDAPLPPENLIAPPECEEEPTGVFACVLIQTPCSTDADCGSGLTCQQQPSAGVCSSGAAPAPGSSGSGSGSGSGGADGSGDIPDSDADRALPAGCTMPEPTYACAPPAYYTAYDTIGRGEATSGQGDIDNGGTVTGTGSPGDEDGEEPPLLSSPGASDPNAEAESGDTMGSSGGCSATGAGASGSALVMLLAVLGLAARRRQQA